MLGGNSGPQYNHPPSRHPRIPLVTPASLRDLVVGALVKLVKLLASDPLVAASLTSNSM